jgi:hypothetical protein
MFLQSEYTMMDWDRATSETRAQLNELPDYSPEKILEEYECLLEKLKTPEIQAMPANAKAFHMQQAFPQFALAYSGLFNRAVRRNKPVPKEAVGMLLVTAVKQKSGEMTEEEAQGVAMQVAESCRQSLRG